jgi:hypothetical protein
MEAGGGGKHDLRGKTIWARRPLVHRCGGASVWSRSREGEEAFAKTRASYPQPGRKEVRVWVGRGCSQQRVRAENDASA